VVDTCGFAPWEALDSVREHVDLFLYDLKLMDDARHREFTGVSNALILSNLQALSQRGHDIVIRLPLIPGINDGEENIRQAGAFVAELPHPIRVDVLPYHGLADEKYGRLNKPYNLSETRPPAGDHVAEAVRILEGFGLQVGIGGG
jgi:pyruvate formate lyase activating enzyme